MRFLRSLPEDEGWWDIIIGVVTDECEGLVEDIMPDLDGTIFCEGLFELQGRAVSFFYKILIARYSNCSMI